MENLSLNEASIRKIKPRCNMVTWPKYNGVYTPERYKY